MRITVFGAGAVGGMIAARLAAHGSAVSVVARGETLAALKRGGLTLDDVDGRYDAPLAAATDDPESLPPQDVLVLALKAHQIAGALPSLRPLLRPETLVAPAINGLPWWYFQGIGGPLCDARLASLDPDGALADAIPAERIAGCVVYVAAEVVQPGRVKSQGFQRLQLGRPVLGGAPGLEAFAEALSAAGFDAPILDDIRQAVWMKLLGNLWANPMSVATEATMGEMLEEPGVYAAAKRMTIEAREVARALGVALDQDIDERLRQSAAGGLKGFRSSMLQDFDRGRSLELDPILGSVLETAQRLGLPTPTLEAVYGIVNLKARTAGLA
ncbi:MAG: 2-dehydropantoate 2-reductase [Alphaproteobacteria bacterium]|nr:2-dehydropantoate 2-reductase [Alphaproteobacteria bacterium]